MSSQKYTCNCHHRCRGSKLVSCSTYIQHKIYHLQVPPVSCGFLQSLGSSPSSNARMPSRSTSSPIPATKVGQRSETDGSNVTFGNNREVIAPYTCVYLPHIYDLSRIDQYTMIHTLLVTQTSLKPPRWTLMSNCLWTLVCLTKMQITLTQMLQKTSWNRIYRVLSLIPT